MAYVTMKSMYCRLCADIEISTLGYLGPVAYEKKWLARKLLARPRTYGAHIAIGPGIATMTDSDIVGMYNNILDSQWVLLQNWGKTVVEEPPGEPQIDYHENSDQWAPRRMPPGREEWIIRNQRSAPTFRIRGNTQ
jgi:hypothetical protein